MRNQHRAFDLDWRNYYDHLQYIAQLRCQQSSGTMKQCVSLKLFSSDHNVTATSSRSYLRGLFLFV